jgi:hypothetical protein
MMEEQIGIGRDHNWIQGGRGISDGWRVIVSVQEVGARMGVWSVRWINLPAREATIV